MPSVKWTCPDCGTEYYLGIGVPMRFCPHCQAIERLKLESIREGELMAMRSIANDIVSQILAERS
jgi:uncharacterized OB-fold protein